LRNELVEELITDFGSGSHAEPDSESVRDGRNRKKEIKKADEREN